MAHTLTVRSPNEFDTEVGARVRVTRKIRGVSQEELANRVGLTFQQIQKYERGANRISASKLKAISEALGVSMSSLLGESEPAAGDRPADWSALADPEVAKLVKAYGKLTPALRKKVLRLAEAAADKR